MIFLYEGAIKHGVESHPLIVKAARLYLADRETNRKANQASHVKASERQTPLQPIETSETINQFIIRTTENGKPYFVDLPIEFSVTNCQDMWMCIMDDSPCGIDLQVLKNSNINKIGERFFKPNEAKYVNTFGAEAFFTLWTMREAYGKRTGEGFWGSMPCFVDDDLNLIREFDDCYIEDIDMGESVKCSICTSKVIAKTDRDNKYVTADETVCEAAEETVCEAADEGLRATEKTRLIVI